MRSKSKKRKEYGDFQTPSELASRILQLLIDLGIYPASIIEPTCGTGSFIISSLQSYPNTQILGFDINSDHLNSLSTKLQKFNHSSLIKLHEANFFNVNWVNIIKSCVKPILIIGNPPWITSSELSALGGKNFPKKSNIYNLKGIEAITGKSNFDVSEWMLIELLKALNEHSGTLAMLCKTRVARKILTYITEQKFNVESINMYMIDTKRYFDASVNACLLICNIKTGKFNYRAKIFSSLTTSSNCLNEISYIDKTMVANLPMYLKWRNLLKDTRKDNSHIKWRSGIKHDCAKVMELIKKGNTYINGYNEIVEIEDEYLFPMVKSSDLAKNRLNEAKKWMIVTQRYIGENTINIKSNAPKTWDYLTKYAKFLDKRASSIYKNRPRYSIFGVGDYSFSPWKIAISGFYKHLKFQILGSILDKPIVLDDTCYFLPVNSFEAATILETLLNQDYINEFYNSLIFWEVKRPITKQILQKLDLQKVLYELSFTELIKLLSSKIPGINTERLHYYLNELNMISPA